MTVPFVETLRENPALLIAIARFNAPSPSEFAPETCPEKAILHYLNVNKTSRVMTRHWLFQQMEIPGYFTDFSEERFRLALMDKADIHCLARVYGGCLYADQVAHCVRREEVAELRTVLGPHYEYVLSRGRFQTRAAHECFAAFRPTTALPGRMAAAGFAALRLCISDWPLALFRLAIPRLPLELHDNSPHAEPGAPDRAATALFWADMKKLLLTRIAPQWQACFA